MKRYRKALILMVLTMLCFVHTSPWTTKKESIKALESDDPNVYYGIVKFYSELADSHDVLYIGDSNFYRGVMPTEIWKQSGLTGYVIALPSQPSWIAYYELKQALQYQKPKVVVIEANQIFKKRTIKQERMVRYLNSMRNDSVRMEAAMDPTFKLSDDYQYDVLKSVMKDQTSDFVSMLNGDPITQGEIGNYKGFILNIKQVPYTGSANYMKENKTTYTFDDETTRYMNEFIKLCKANEIQVVMIKVPAAVDWSAEGAALAQTYADQAGIPFYDFNTGMKQHTINWQSDTYDGGTHLNVYGAEKLSAELGTYLMQHYSFDKDKSDDVIASFKSGYEMIQKQKEIMAANCDMNDDER